MDQTSWSGNVQTLVETNSHLRDPSDRKKQIFRNVSTSSAIEGIAVEMEDSVEDFRRAASRVLSESLGRDVTRVEAEILFAVATQRVRLGGEYLQGDD